MCKSCLEGMRRAKGSKQPLRAFANGEATSGGIHGTNVLDVHEFFAQSQVFPVEDGSVGHVLGQQSNTVLRSICLDVGVEVQVIDEDNESLGCRRTVAATRTFVNREAPSRLEGSWSQ